MKPFLLIAGDHYYPSKDTGDWRGCFETYEQALSMVKNIGDECDWFCIIDLRPYMGITIDQ